VERGQIPISVAVTIASSNDDEVQRALADAYANNDLRGKQLLRARRVIEARRTSGKTIRGGRRRADPEISGDALMQTYKRETAKQRLLVQKAKVCETRLLFVASALRQVLADGAFVAVLQAGGAGDAASVPRRTGGNERGLAMTAGVRMGFDSSGVTLRLDQILPVRVIRPEARRSPQYQRLLASIRELGVIEPLVVHPHKKADPGEPRFTLLDGHTRLEVLKELGCREAFCLVATDDEAFTYNHKVNRVAPIQEHFMIMRALQSGVSEERIARTLSVDVGAIRQKRDMLNGVCPEVVAMLKDRRVTVGALREIRRATPLRQIEMAELMVAANNFSTSYARCLIAATPEKELLPHEKAKAVTGVRPEDVARMEREMSALSRDFRAIEESHGRNTLNLVLAVAYLRKLLDHAPAVRYLSQHHAEILAEFQKLADTPDLKS
jgi:hypothetical protein